MPRLFLAIPLPDDVRDRLAEMRLPTVAGMRRVGRGAMHVTLHFLGEVAKSDVDRLQTALAQVKGRAFSLVLRGVGRFPTRGQPTVLWAGVEHSAPLVELHQLIGTVLTETIGFQPERRTYAPHVTLARCNAPTSPDVIEPFLEKYKTFELPAILVEKFTLYSSVVVDRAPQYEIVAEVRLLEPGSAGVVPQ